jgi:hypothetical protein
MATKAWQGVSEVVVQEEVYIGSNFGCIFHKRSVTGIVHCIIFPFILLRTRRKSRRRSLETGSVPSSGQGARKVPCLGA